MQTQCQLCHSTAPTVGYHHRVAELGYPQDLYGISFAFIGKYLAQRFGLKSGSLRFFDQFTVAYTAIYPVLLPININDLLGAKTVESNLIEFKGPGRRSVESRCHLSEHLRLCQRLR